MDTEEIRRRFDHHSPDQATGDLHSMVRSKVKSLAFELNDLLPEGRQKSLAFTALEDVMMRSNAAIAQREKPR